MAHKRHYRGLAVGLILISLFLTPHSWAKEAAPGLAALAESRRSGFLMGSHAEASLIGENKTYREILKKEYNMVSVGIYASRTQRRSADDWNFATVDPVIDFARANGMKVYAHPMFGSDEYLPAWMKNDTLTHEQLLGLIEARIKKILTRYRGKIDILDVYNEGLYREEHGWREKENIFLRLGYHENEYGKWPVALEKMLIWCRQYGGDKLKLIYNDNRNTLAGQPQSEDCIALFKALRHAGIPIDGIGIQCHNKITEAGRIELGAMPGGVAIEFDPDRMAENLRRMGEAGIDVYISECDIHLYGKIDEAKLRQQAQAYAAIVKVCIESPACKAFKTWGFTDASCWKPMQKKNSEYRYEPCPLVFDLKMKPKPAYYALRDTLGGSTK